MTSWKDEYFCNIRMDFEIECGRVLLNLVHLRLLQMTAWKDKHIVRWRNGRRLG